MCELLGDIDNQLKYTSIAERAQSVYIKELWNGEYLNYDNRCILLFYTSMLI